MAKIKLKSQYEGAKSIVFEELINELYETVNVNGYERITKDDFIGFDINNETTFRAPSFADDLSIEIKSVSLSAVDWCIDDIINTPFIKVGPYYGFLPWTNRCLLFPKRDINILDGRLQIPTLLVAVEFKTAEDDKGMIENAFELNGYGEVFNQHFNFFWPTRVMSFIDRPSWRAAIKLSLDDNTRKLEFTVPRVKKIKIYDKSKSFIYDSGVIRTTRLNPTCREVNFGNIPSDNVLISISKHSIVVSTVTKKEKETANVEL